MCNVEEPRFSAGRSSKLILVIPNRDEGPVSACPELVEGNLLFAVSTGGGALEEILRIPLFRRHPEGPRFLQRAEGSLVRTLLSGSSCTTTKHRRT